MPDPSDSFAADRRPGEGRGPIARREHLGPGLRRDDASKVLLPPRGSSVVQSRDTGFPPQPAPECLSRGQERRTQLRGDRGNF